jgi:hypothetical protein
MDLFKVSYFKLFAMSRKKQFYETMCRDMAVARMAGLTGIVEGLEVALTTFEMFYGRYSKRK